MRAILMMAAFCAVLAGSLAAQKSPPKRPALPSGADTCDAMAYFKYGMEQLETAPFRAADAFYWAARVDPTWADPLFARRVALLLTNQGRLGLYLDGNRRTIESAEIKQIDSLQYRALTMNPFVYRGLEKSLLTTYLREEYQREVRMEGGQPNMAAFDYWLQGVFRRDAADRAYWAYGSGDLASAVEAYGQAMRGAKDKSWLHAQRGRVFFLQGQMDSAKREMEAALATMREKDEKKLVYVYESKALYEHSIGLLLETKGDLAGAKEAYGRALQEDMSYYPAHVRTSVVAMRSGDSTGAVAAMQLAAQIRPDDPAVLVGYGELLLALNKPAEAEEPLRHAVELNDDFSAAHFDLAQALDRQGKKVPAATEYRAFLDHASRGHKRRADAEARLRALTPAAGGAS